MFKMHVFLWDLFWGGKGNVGRKSWRCWMVRKTITKAKTADFLLLRKQVLTTTSPLKYNDKTSGILFLMMTLEEKMFNKPI